MDLFDDAVTNAPAPRARPGGRFAPKAKSKQQPQKNVSTSENGNNVHVASSKESERISQKNESNNAVAVSSSTDEPIRFGNHPDINFDNVTTHPVEPANAVETELNDMAAPSTTCSNIGRMEELPNNGEGSFVDTNKCLEVIDNSLEVSLNAGFASASGDINTAISEGNIHSNFEFGEVQEVFSAEIELDPFSNILPDTGTRNAHKFQPKIKPRPRVSNTPAIASAASGIPFSEDNRSLEASLNAMSSETVVHDGTGDLPSTFGKSAAETADIFSGLESLDDIINQAATSTGKQVLNSFNVKGAEENFVLPRYDNKSRSETQEGPDLNPDRPIDNAYDYQSIKSGTDPTSEIPRHEELTNSADSPTLADFLQPDGTGEKEDANDRKNSLKKKNKRSSIAGVEDKGGKNSKKPRKQTARKPAKNSLNEAVEDDDVLDPPYEFDKDELEENDDEDEVDYSSKNTNASTSSKKKSVAKKGKTSEKRKKANDDLEKITEEPPKKFSHSSRRRKRTVVDKALLDDEYLDYRTLPIRQIISIADYREQLAKKEARTAKTSSANQSGGDVLHEADANFPHEAEADADFPYEADANNEDDFFGLDDDYRDPDDNKASEKVTTAPLLNYQSFMDKAPRGKWSKQDTEKFYEAVRQFGTDFSMIQELFSDKTRHQIKLKYKKEERQNPLLLSDALSNRSSDLSFLKLLVEKQKQKSKEEQDIAGDASDIMPWEEVEDPTPGTNEEVATTKPEQDHTVVKDQEDSMSSPIPEKSDDSEDELERWSQYQSAI